MESNKEYLVYRFDNEVHHEAFKGEYRRLLIIGDLPYKLRMLVYAQFNESHYIEEREYLDELDVYNVFDWSNTEGGIKFWSNVRRGYWSSYYDEEEEENDLIDRVFEIMKKIK